MTLNFWASRNMYVRAGTRYCCRRFSISESSGSRGSGTTGRARFSDRSIAERVLKLSGTAVRHPLAPSGASTEVPRRISLGFAHSAAAPGHWRRGGRTQHVPVGKPFAFPVSSGCCTLTWPSCDISVIFTTNFACGSACRAESPAQIGRRTLTFTHM